MAGRLQAWTDAFRPACRARGMRFVGGEGFVIDDVYLAALGALVFDAGTDGLRIDWDITVKPLAVDDILWAAFLPDVAMGPQKRINRRINGAFTIRPLRVARGSLTVAKAAEPDWAPILDEFERVRAEFVAARPTIDDFVVALQDLPDGVASGRGITRRVTALMAAGRNEEAVSHAEAARARGESGSMSSTVDVLDYLAAYAKGPQAYSAFRASLVPTHDYQVLHHGGRDVSVSLSREHHPGRMRETLETLNGSDPWAVVLEVRPPLGGSDDPAAVRYLQAAGTAAAMTVEIRQPGGVDADGVSVRSVLGHRQSGPAVYDVVLELPHDTETIGRHEVFTAAEAADLFDAFYRADTLGDSYVLRPVEWFDAEGATLR